MNTQVQSTTSYEQARQAKRQAGAAFLSLHAALQGPHAPRTDAGRRELALARQEAQNRLRAAQDAVLDAMAGGQGA